MCILLSTHQLRRLFTPVTRLHRQTNEEGPSDPCRNYDVPISLSSLPPKHRHMPAMTNSLWRAPVNMARKDPLPLLGADSRESSSGQDAPVSALGPLAAREPFSAFRWERQCRRSCLDGKAGCTRGAKEGAVGVDPVVNLIPQMQKFMHRWIRTCSKAVPIFSLSYWADSCCITAVKQSGSECCLEASNTTQSLKLGPISEEERKGGQVTPELQGQQVNNG